MKNKVYFGQKLEGFIVHTAKIVHKCSRWMHKTKKGLGIGLGFTLRASEKVAFRYVTLISQKKYYFVPFSFIVSLFNKGM